jgi:hypothetical protein
VHEVLADLFFGRFLAQLPRQIVRRRLPDQRLAAPGWPVKQKSFRSGMVKFLEQMRMQKRQLDRILDRVDRSLLPADFRPGQFRDVIEIMFVRAGRRHHFQRHTIIGVHPYFVALFQRRFCQLRGTLQHQRLCPVFIANA